MCSRFKNFCQDLNFRAELPPVCFAVQLKCSKETTPPPTHTHTYTHTTLVPLQRSPMNVFRVPRRGAAKKRGGGPTVVDSSYERPTSPLLGFHSPLQVRRGRMVHAKSCDMTPLRLKLSMRRRPEADAESNSSDESWNVAAIELNQECQVCHDSRLMCVHTIAHSRL